MAIKMPAERLGYYKFQQWKHDIQFVIRRTNGDFRLEDLTINGNQCVVSGYAFDETYGLEVITERYDAKEMIELYLM